MHSDRVAESILTLVAGPELAASTVGDLLEETQSRGRLWFWIYVAGTTLSFLWRGLIVAPVRMTGYALIAWFMLMLVAVIWSFFGFIAMTLIWGMSHFFAHHTGLELLANLIRFRFDWPPLPAEVTRWIETAAMVIIAPVQVGRITARYWPGRELAAWVFMFLLWPLLAFTVPFVAMLTKASPAMLLVIEAFVLVGMLWERRISRVAQLKL
jgi:hypothetical protein